MKKNGRRMWAVVTREDGKPEFHRFTNGPCPICGLKECLPDQSHGPGQFFHADLRRFVTLDEAAARMGDGDRLEPRLPEGFRSVKAYERDLQKKQEERRRKTKDRVRRHRQRKRLGRSGM